MTMQALSKKRPRGIGRGGINDGQFLEQFPELRQVQVDRFRHWLFIMLYANRRKVRDDESYGGILRDFCTSVAESALPIIDPVMVAGVIMRMFPTQAQGVFAEEEDEELSSRERHSKPIRMRRALKELKNGKLPAPTERPVPAGIVLLGDGIVKVKGEDGRYVKYFVDGEAPLPEVISTELTLQLWRERDAFLTKAKPTQPCRHKAIAL